MSTQVKTDTAPIKRTVLDVDDVYREAPIFKGHPRLAQAYLNLLQLDKVNVLHDKFCDTPGVPFVNAMLDDLDIRLLVDNAGILDGFPPGTPFVTVSNHPFGALDGISLIKLVGKDHPDFKVMVNMFLNHIGAMRPNFIAVDSLATDDPARKAVSMRGIKEVIRQIKSGHPVGFFPAGAVSKVKRNMRLEDRPWQPNVMRLIMQLQVPVVPIFFHGRNSALFNIMGMISWQLRTLRLAAEVFRKRGSTIHISVGQPVSVEEQQLHQGSPEEFGQFLKARTYELRDKYRNK